MLTSKTSMVVSHKHGGKERQKRLQYVYKLQPHSEVHAIFSCTKNVVSFLTRVISRWQKGLNSGKHT